MATIRFNAPHEFTEELALQKDAVEGGIVRVTRMWGLEDSRDGTHLRTLTIVATALADGHLLRLDKLIGTSFAFDAGYREKLRDKSEEVMNQLEAWLRDKGFVIRAGVYEL